MKDSQEVLAELLGHLKISGNKLASEIGLKANTAIYHVKNGRNRLSPDLANKITERYPELNYNWLLTGEGEMLKSEEKHKAATVADDEGEEYVSLKSVRDEIRGDLKKLMEGVTDNFEVVNEGLIHLVTGQEKIHRFIEGIDGERLKETAGALREFLKARKE